MFIPYVQIGHVKIVRQEHDSDLSNGQTTEFEFQTLYHVDSYPYDKTIEVIMATGCSLAALCAALRAYRSLINQIIPGLVDQKSFGFPAGDVVLAN